MGNENMMVLNRNYTLTTTLGHSIQFRKGEPTHVPPMLYQAAIGIGAVRADGADPDVIKDEPRGNQPPADPLERTEAVRRAIESVVRANERFDFTAAGVPTVTAVSEVAGWKVSAREIAHEWHQRGERELEARQAQLS